MRLQHVLEQVFHKPWLITPAGHATIATLIERKLTDNEVDGMMKIRSADTSLRGPDFFSGDPLPGMTITHGIAEIPVHGVIGQRMGQIEKSCGAVDVNDLVSELEQANADPTVRAILFNIDSPGGMVSGTAEAADAIAASPKPTYTFSDGSVASAAYWLAASTGGLFGTRGSEWGSIGVYIPWRDTSGLYEQAGIKVKVFSSGTYKGMGVPGTELTKEQEQYLQQTVNDLANEFYSHVRQNRGQIADGDMQGQMFSASRARRNGFLDGIVKSKLDLLWMI